MSDPTDERIFQCPKCREKTAITFWIQAFASIEQARMHGSTPDFMAGMMPEPGLLKIQICTSCPSLHPCMQYTAKELKEMNEITEAQKKRAASADSIGKLLGFGGPKKQ